MLCVILSPFDLFTRSNARQKDCSLSPRVILPDDEVSVSSCDTRHVWKPWRETWWEKIISITHMPTRTVLENGSNLSSILSVDYEWLIRCEGSRERKSGLLTDQKLIRHELRFFVMPRTFISRHLWEGGKRIVQVREEKRWWWWKRDKKREMMRSLPQGVLISLSQDRASRTMEQTANSVLRFDSHLHEVHFVKVHKKYEMNDL